MADARRRMERPSVSCEITANSVIVARTRDRKTIETVYSRALPAGAVVPNLMGENIHDANAVRDAIADALNAAGGRVREVIAVVPDMTSRVALLDFDTFPTRHDEAEAVVRLRLKKSIPFDIDKASVSFDANRGPRTTRVIAAVMLRSVLEQYESVFRSAGCEPGVVIPSTLAALGVVNSTGPTMFLKADGASASLAIVDQEQLLLLRTLGTGTSDSVEVLTEDVYPSLVFFQDTFGTNVDKILVAGVKDFSALRTALSEQWKVPVEDVANSPAMPSAGAKSESVGAIGALL